MVALLAAAVVACTSAALTLPATTMTGDGMENNLTEGTTTALAVDPNAASSETAVDSSTPESVAPAVEESAPQSAPETTEESEPAESETVSDPAAQTEETAALPQGAEVPADCTQPYTFHDDENGFTVTVWAPEGAFNEEVTLKAKLLDETDSAYAEAKQELDEKAAEEPALLSEDGETPDYGFAALDIHFENAAGEEIEPQGEVYVAIDADKLLPEDADPDSVMVQHHAEQDNGDVTVETVADTADETDGKIETTAASDDTANVQAAFEVNQFSTFTITWKEYGQEYFNVTVHYVDENGWQIQGPHSDYYGPYDSISDGWSNNTITFDAEYAGEITGYTFQGAHYNTFNGSVVTSMRGSYEGNYLSRPTLTFYNGTQQIASLTHYYIDGTTTADVYLVYTKNGGGQGGNPGGGGEVTQEATVTTGKTAVLRDDGNYDLTLTVSGDRGSSNNKQQLDVLFVLDESNSMMKGWGYNTRWSAARNAISQILGIGPSEGLSDNTSLDVRYSLVQFAGGQNTRGYYNDSPWNDASVLQGWTNNAQILYNKIPNSLDSERYDGGTNYEAGLSVGNNQLEKAREDAVTAVIFITDGNPGFYYDKSGYTNGTADPENETSNGYDETALRAAVAECKQIDADYFYLVGVTNTVQDKVFNDLYAAIQLPSSNKGKYTSNSAEDLLDAFNDLEGKLTFFAAEKVTMIDPLSSYAEIVTTGEGNTIQFNVKLEKKDSNGVYQQVDDTQTINSGSSATFKTVVKDDNNQSEETTVYIKPVYNAQTRTITVTLTGENGQSYALAPGYRYSISTVIKPSQKAITAGANSYNGTGEANTGTYAGEQGFWSNDNENAKVTYTANGEEGSKNFPKPVIQVTDTTPSTASVSFHKVNGDGNTPLAGAEFNLYYEKEGTKYYYVQIPEPDGTEKFDWYTEAQIASSSSGTSTVKKYAYTSGDNGLFTIADLPTDKAYYLVEVKAPDGYQLLEDAIYLVYQGKGESKKWAAYSNTASTESGSVANVLETDENGAYYIHNTTGTRLPETGSIGTTPFATIGGPLFAVCAVGLGFGLRRRRGKEAK